MGKYDDIIHLPHHQSTKHPPMPNADRAAQFAPFAALTGYEAAIEESARMTDLWREPTDEQKEQIWQRLTVLREHSGEKMSAEIEWFQPDEKKSGGSYQVSRGVVTKIDADGRTVKLEHGEQLALDGIVRVDSPLFDRDEWV